jgi:hypothetical protein
MNGVCSYALMHVLYADARATDARDTRGENMK